MVLFLSLMVIVILGPALLIGILWPIFDKNFVDKMVEETKNNPEHRGRKNKYHRSWVDEDDATDMYGNPLHPDRYERTKKKEWKKWLKMQD